MCHVFARLLKTQHVRPQFNRLERSVNKDRASSENIIEQARQELLALHLHERQAHFATDADTLVAPFAESIINVRNGAVQHITREDMRQVFTEYFKNATYHEWDDLHPPIVHVSPDGKLGWMITETKVRRDHIDEAGVKRERTFIYAGIMTYEKREDQWICTANVSTFEAINT
jgi:hypothetical protein